jgi:DNA-binding Lrp family transcriptional regulator
MMSEKDMQILSMLRKNGRETLTVMSKETQIPISTIFDRVAKFNRKIITKYTGLVDFQELGFNARACVMIKANNSTKERLYDYLSNHQNVNSIYKINNGFDFMIDIVFRNVRNLEEFLQTLEDKYRAKDRIVYYIIDEMKQEEFLTKPEVMTLV